MRPTLPQEKIDTNAQQSMAAFHAEIVKEAQEAVRANRFCVLGMSGNPFVKKARNALQAKNIEFKYLEYGSYLSQWKPRLAIKLWSGWPTFPQVFVDGKLVGGYTELKAWLEKGNA